MEIDELYSRQNYIKVDSNSQNFSIDYEKVMKLAIITVT